MNIRNSTGAAHHRVVYRLATGDILAVVAGFGSGAGLMYLLDLKRRLYRRGQDIAEFTAFIQQDGGAMAKRRAKYLLDRVRRLAAKDVSALAEEEAVANELPTERIRRGIGQGVMLANKYVKKRSLFVAGWLTGVTAGIASLGKRGSARQLKC